MTKMNKCYVCEKKAKRLCPGTDGIICSICCGSKRNSEIKCAPDCVHSPFSVAGYDSWLKVDAAVAMKFMKYVSLHYSEAEFRARVEDMYYEEHGPIDEAYTLAAGSAALNILFIEQNKTGKTLASNWEAEGWGGLNNDERMMMKYLKDSRVTIIEIQKVLDYQTMKCIDILDPEHKPFILLDRNMAKRAIRFTKLFTWLAHFSNFSKALYGGVEISDFVYNEFMDEIHRVAAKGLKRNKQFNIKDKLSENFGKYCQITFELAREKQKAMLNRMDMHQCIATYEIKGNYNGVELILEKYPEFEWDDIDPEEGDPEGTLYYRWLRRGKSKEIETHMHSAFRHKDESMGVGTLGNITVCSSELRIEVFSKQKYEFAKKMAKQYFGELIALKREKVVDIARQMAEKPMDAITETEGREEEAPIISPEDERKALQIFYEDKYKNFLDEKIPMIDNHTPKQASKIPRLKPELTELMKLHIKGIEKTNREKGTDINIDWILKEVDMSELM